MTEKLTEWQIKVTKQIVDLEDVVTELLNVNARAEKKRPRSRFNRLTNEELLKL